MIFTSAIDFILYWTFFNRVVSMNLKSGVFNKHDNVDAPQHKYNYTNRRKKMAMYVLSSILNKNKPFQPKCSHKLENMFSNCVPWF